MLTTSKVKWFDPDKGWGFINNPIVGGPDIFVHQSEIAEKGYPILKKDECVSFELKEVRKGLQAKKVTRC